MEEKESNIENSKNNSNFKEEPTSLISLISWNISKALDKNPCIDLKSAIKAAEERMERDVESMVHQFPEERHLACALLAWQQLGHSDAESLYKFVENKKIEHECTCKKNNQDKTVVAVKDINTNKDLKTPKELECTCNKNKNQQKTPAPVKVIDIESDKDLKTPNKHECACNKNNNQQKTAAPVKVIDIETNKDLKTPTKHECACKMNNREKTAAPIKNKDIDSDKDLKTLNKHECACKINNREKTTSPIKDIDIDSDKHCKSLNISKPKTVVPPGMVTYFNGPVVKLPICTNIIMRMDSTHQNPRQTQQNKVKCKDATSKIDEACCMDSGCVERLALVDAGTTELRERAKQLARREAQRVELLERAEAAWRDLEVGYQRRISVAEEKEEDMTKEIEKLIEERNGYKSACTGLVKELKEKGDAAESDKDLLVELEKQVYEHACVKLHASEDCARAEAELAQQQCKAAQLDRDLQFKEEQTRRKKLTLEDEQEAACALTIEAERTLRGELSALREQIKLVSNDLLVEDAENRMIKDELEKLREEKMGMVEDLEGCKESCDSRMQGKLDELKQKRQKLAELKDEAMECKCKLPIDEIVEVKRTPSLAALCRCTPEDKLLQSCSCTSLRERLLSNLLADLFAGLQAELGGSGAEMPCQLLKCLEDKHNWDRGSAVKSNLRNFFSQLLIGELDIAIATSIEKYHAKWVGASCADDIKEIRCRTDDQDDGWEQRAIERKAQKLATKLAEQLFQERADKLTERAKQIVKAGPPPCECKPKEATEEAKTPAILPCLVTTTMQNGGKTAITKVTNTGGTGLWKRTQQDVTLLRLQIEDLKKDSIKKEDLTLMEQKIAKIVQKASGADNDESMTSTKDNLDSTSENHKKEKNACDYRPINHNKSPIIKKRILELNHKKGIRSPPTHSPLNERNTRLTRRFGPAYAVNMCLCGPQKEQQVKVQPNKVQHDPSSNDQTAHSTWKQKIPRDNAHPISSIKTKPIRTSFPSPKVDMSSSSKSSARPYCPSDCICFHKRPSNTSIDKLLETLTKWKSDLSGTQEIFTINTASDQNNQNLRNQMQDVNISGDQNISLETSKKSTPINDSQIGAYKLNIATDSEINHILPLATESEYMGAINLDKSNENYCNCPKKVKNSNKSKGKSRNMKTSNVFKCINSDACNCKDSLEIEQEIKKPLLESDRPPQILYSSPDARSKENITLEVKQDQPDSQNKQSKVLDVKTLSNKSDCTSADCEYHIKFLGVTLTGANSLELAKGLRQNENNDPEDHSPSKNNRNRDHAGNQGNYYTNPSNILNTPNDLYNRNNHSENNNDATKPNNPKFNGSYRFADVTSNDEYGENMRNDNNIVLKSTQESCVCCKSNMDDAKDIEVNVFHLIEDHLKGKLKDFKSFSCKSSCIPSHEEEKIFTDIIQKVKQVISDCANEMKCKCPGDNINNDESWNRAYGLLQEYLKIKIQRVQCLCVSLNDDKNLALGNILDKVCNLIEHDFERLKDICKCKNNAEIRRHVQSEKKVKETEEMPEKDINSPEFELVINKMNPIMDTMKSMMLTEKNVSAQVSLGLGMETRSCDAMSVKTRNMQTTETDAMFPLGYLNPKEVTKIDCDCYCNTVNQGNGPFLELFGTNEVLVSLCKDIVKKSDNLCNIPMNILESTPVQINELGFIEKNLQQMDLNENKNDTIQTAVENKLNVPYIGYTVDCSCDSNLGSCICMKSVVQANNNNIKRIWNTFMAKNGNIQDVSYIMNSAKNNISNNPVVDTMPPSAVAETSNRSICEIEINTPNEEEIILLDCKDNVNIAHNTTNTKENISLATECSTNDWSEYSQGLKPNETKSNKDVLNNSIYYPLPLDYDKHFKSETAMQATYSQQGCECDVVPLCHVKMLVKNIENNLMNSKCTCDSMIAKVCPVHSERV